MKKLNHHLITRYKIFLAPLLIILIVPLVLWLTGWFDVMIRSNWTTEQGGDEDSRNGLRVYIRRGDEYYFKYDFIIHSGAPELQIYSVNCELQEEMNAEAISQLKEEDYILLDAIKITESQTLEINLNEYPRNAHYYVSVEADSAGDYEFTCMLYAKNARWRRILDKLTGNR